jgi:hypothetical protein
MIGTLDQLVQAVQFTPRAAEKFDSIAGRFDVSDLYRSKLATCPDDTTGQLEFSAGSEIDRNDDASSGFEGLPRSKVGTAARKIGGRFFSATEEEFACDRVDFGVDGRNTDWDRRRDSWMSLKSRTCLSPLSHRIHLTCRSHRRSVEGLEPIGWIGAKRQRRNAFELGVAP